MTGRRRRLFATGFRWLAVLAWAGLIWRLITLSPEKMPGIGFIDWEDKVGHAGVFCVWGFLICWAVSRPAGSLHALSRTGVAVMSVLAGAAYGVLTELYQAGIGRNADVLDMLADVAGAVVAPYLYFSSKLRDLVKRVTAKRGGRMRRVGRQARSSPLKADAEGSLKPSGEAEGEGADSRLQIAEGETPLTG